MNINAMFKISYGLYILTSRDKGKDNGCIINTFSQVTDTPNRVSVTVNKNNYTHDMIKNTGDFNVFLQRKLILLCLSILDSRVEEMLLNLLIISKCQELKMELYMFLRIRMPIYREK